MCSYNTYTTRQPSVDSRIGRHLRDSKVDVKRNKIQILLYPGCLLSKRIIKN